MINTIKYFEQTQADILIIYDDHNILKPASYRDDEINEWLLTHEIEAWVDPVDYQNKMRGERDRLLVVSDWTQLPDVPLSEEEVLAWRTYRQDLRDFPNEHPEVVDEASYNALVWPVPPE